VKHWTCLSETSLRRRGMWFHVLVAQGLDAQAMRDKLGLGGGGGGCCCAEGDEGMRRGERR
jgi:hypothetical protein